MKRERNACVISLAVLVFLFLIIGNVGAADAPAIGWQKLLGGSNDDSAYSSQQTSDGGYILTGETLSSESGDVTGVIHSRGYRDVWVVKLDNTGSIQWQKLLGGSHADSANSIRQTSDGGYILTGWTGSNRSGDVGDADGWTDIWVVKLDSSGTIQWQNVLGGSNQDYGYSIWQTRDGGYILTGTSESSESGDVTGKNHGVRDVWVVKLDSTGTPEWQKLLGGSLADSANSIRQTGDGGYILTGWTRSNRSGDVTGTNHGIRDVWVVKLDHAGTLEWQKLLGGSNDEEGRNIQQTTDGGYILTGWTTSSASGDVTGTSHGIDDIWVVKLESTGALQWQKLLGGNSHDNGYSIWQTGDGGYILAGSTVSSNSGDVGANNGAWDVWVVKLDSAGIIRWQKLLGGSDTDWANSIQQTSDGGYFLAGLTRSGASGDVTETNHGGADFWVVKLNEDSILPLPGCTSPPTDPDGDGIYEDLNGNGRLDFADVVLFFNEMTWIADNEPIAAFDLNGNGRIDFADIVMLFNEV